MSVKNIYGQDLQDLETEFKSFTVKKIYRSLYKRNTSLTLNRSETNSLKNFDFTLPTITNQQTSPDGTTKFLMKFQDGKQVETVLIPFYKKYTICLSTQVGCAMKCSFCHTATQGLERNLKTHEIVGQYLKAYQYHRQQKGDLAPTPNIVFMGQGEPLHNFDELKKAINIFLTTEGLHLGPRQITVSTAGYLPGLKRFHELYGVNFALSLHSPFDTVRSKLIPLNQAYPLDKLFEVIDQIPRKKRQYINCEYLLIKDLNDNQESIDGLYRLLKDRPAIINLIPFNEFPGSHYKRPSKEKVDWFKEELVKRNIYTMIRTTKGDDILAACGQLKSQIS